MRLHLVDGTYELFRAFFGAPEAESPAGIEVGATRGLLRSLLALIRDEPVTHGAVAFDTVIRSFRNDLFEGYKTGEGIDADLLGQFPLAERAAHALGLTVWPMIQFEADDALATGAASYGRLAGVEQVIICSPDKDLTQCVRGREVVCLDRRRKRLIDEDAVRERYGIAPGSIPDWLALVGDAADGIPGIPRWGARSTSRVLARYPTIEEIPEHPGDWDLEVRGAESLARNLNAARADAALYKELATLRGDVPLGEKLSDLRWRGARRRELTRLCREIGEEDLVERVHRWMSE